jgi:drug/metabolite transporter (DMT)-like permease
LTENFERDRDEDDRIGNDRHLPSRRIDVSSENVAARDSIARITTLWALFVSLDALAQLLFKNAAVGLPEPSMTLRWVYLVATSVGVWTALGCLALVFALWMMILRESPLGTAFPMTALTYVVVVVASQVVFNETLAPLQYTGIALIIVGVAMLRPSR